MILVSGESLIPCAISMIEPNVTVGIGSGSGDWGISSPESNRNLLMVSHQDDVAVRSEMCHIMITVMAINPHRDTVV